MMAPTLWFEEYIEIPSNLKTQITLAFGVAPLLISFCGFGSIIVGIAFLIYGHIVYSIRPVSSTTPDKSKL